MSSTNANIDLAVLAGEVAATRGRVEELWPTPPLDASVGYLSEECDELFKALFRRTRAGDLRTRSDAEADKAPREIGQVLLMAITTANLCDHAIARQHISPTTPLKDAAVTKAQASVLYVATLNGKPVNTATVDEIVARALNIADALGVDAAAELRAFLGEVERRVERKRAAAGDYF